MASGAARSLPTTTTTQRIRVEACRASVLALHAAAGLASGPDADRQLLRVLRSAEALARTAVAIASSLPKSAAPATTRLSPGPGGDASRAVDGAVLRAGARRRRRSKKNKATENVEMVDSARQPGEVPLQPVPQPLDPGATAFQPSAGRVLKAQVSRERSPYRTISSASASNASEVHMVDHRYAVDDIVIITDVQSRPELVNLRCRVLGYDDDGGRYRVSIEDTGEMVRLKPDKLQRCLFPQNFRAAAV